MKRFSILPLTLAISALSPGAQAQSTADPKLEQIVVSAARSDQKLSDVTAPITLITRDQIEQLQPPSVIDLLRLVPGVSISTNGGKGAQASLFLRGTNSGHTLVLVDGQRISSATLGGTSFQFLDPDQIERIEIVRGPRSSLYGSEAIGGVIHIITRNAAAEPGASLKLSVGNRDSQKAVLSATARGTDTTVSLTASHYTTEGINNFATDQMPQGDDDAFRNSSISLNVNHKLGDALKLGFSVFNTKAMNEIDSNYGYYPYSESEIFSSRAFIDYQFSESLDAHFELGNSRDESVSQDEDKINDPNVYEYTTNRNSMLLQVNSTVNHWLTMSYGMENITDRIESSSDYEDQHGNPVDSREQSGTFLQGQASIDQWIFGFGLRNDNIEDFDDQFTGNLALSYQFELPVRITGSYGTAFKVPTFNDLYFPDSPLSAGNPDLKAESSENYEIEIKANLNTGQLAYNLYRNDIENLIEWAPDSNYKYMPHNIAEAEITGHELTYFVELFEAWSVNTGATWIKAIDKNSDKRLQRRPLRSAFVQVDYGFGPFNVGITVKAQSESAQDDANTSWTSGFATADLRGAYTINDNIKLFLNIDNALDKEYQIVNGYNTEDRTTTLAIEMRL